MRGYPIDLRAKAHERSDAEWRRVRGPIAIWVAVTQRGLGCYERWLAGEGEVWLAAACEAADILLAAQQSSGHHSGGWLHEQPLLHTFTVPVPWASAMAQGQAASLLTRMYSVYRTDRYAEAARSALKPFAVPVQDGGVKADLDGYDFPEEYPTRPPSYVLNGAIFALWGLHDVAIGFDDAAVRESFDQGVEMLASTLGKWDLGWWSRYDLFPHRVLNVASSFYQHLHATQLAAMNMLAPRAEFALAAARWKQNLESADHRALAFAHKVRFRLLTPRR